MEIRTLHELFDEYRARFLPDRAHGVDGAVQLRLSGEDGGDWILEVRDRALRIEPGVHEAPLATVACRVQDWIAVSTGRANPMALVIKGRMKVTGAMATAMRFQQLFRVG